MAVGASWSWPAGSQKRHPSRSSCQLVPDSWAAQGSATTLCRAGQAGAALLTCDPSLLNLEAVQSTFEGRTGQREPDGFTLVVC